MKRVLNEIIRRIKDGMSDPYMLADMVNVLAALYKEDLEYARGKAKEIWGLLSHLPANSYDSKYAIVQARKQILLLEAPHNFDAYMRYTEWDREPGKCFYPCRRQALRSVVRGMQELADDKLDLLCVSLPPGSGKTTLSLFYLTWLAGRQPDKSILGVSHSASIVQGMYGEVIRMLEKDGEYLFNDVFPESPLANTNAKLLMIDLEKEKRFSSIEFTSIGAGNSGKYRAMQLLYCDDLVPSMEVALNREALDKLYNTYYLGDLLQRKTTNCKELHVATRWSVADPIGRLELANEGNDRARFIRIPALNENDESNFDYGQGFDGFTTEFYKNQREMLDEASWLALYQNEPIEREGLLFDVHELRRYFDLPEEEPDAIVAVCDTKDRGADYCVLPVAYQYGSDFYIESFICDNGKPEIIDERLVNILYKHKVKLCRFESNSAGGKIAEKVAKELKEKGGITSISTKFTTANKETKIVVNSPYVKEHFLFKDDSVADKEYKTAMNMLCSYTMAGKNKHDDVPDAMSMLAEFVQSFGLNSVKVLKRII